MALSDGFRLGAIDPGKTTGWAVMSSGGVEASGEVVVLEEDDWREAELGAVRAVMSAVGRVDAWACEDFILRGRSMGRDLLSPVRVAAMLFALAEGPMLWVSPSDAKGLVTNDRLREWDAWVRGRHARDAVRVGMVAMRRLSG